jgi:hypothetical protein
MNKILLILVTLALATSAIPQQPSAKQTLFDFRVDRKFASPRITAATQRAVLSKVFRKYLTDQARCNSEFASDNSDPLKAARLAGQIVPSIIDMATGSFTAPGQTQIAYVISVSECNASHADNFGTKRVAIFSGQQLVTDVDVDFKSSIVRRTDLNGDGMDELLMVSGDMNQGIVIEMGALLDFRNGKLRVLQDFGTVTDDSCASEIQGSSTRAAVLTYSPAGPGDMPRIRSDNYQASCRGAKRWRFLSTGKMPD